MSNQPDPPPFPYGESVIFASLYGLFCSVAIIVAAQITLHFMDASLATLTEIFSNGWMLFIVIFLTCFILALDDSIQWYLDWVDRHCQQQQRRRNPTPHFYSNRQAAAKGLTLRRQDDGLVPHEAAHYAQIYHRLERKRGGNKWKITRRDLEVKHGSVAAFSALSDKYPRILAHWTRLGWAEEKDSAYYLTADGQWAFIDNSGVHLIGEHPPTE